MHAARRPDRGEDDQREEERREGLDEIGRARDRPLEATARQGRGGAERGPDREAEERHAGREREAAELGAADDGEEVDPPFAAAEGVPRGRAAPRERRVEADRARGARSPEREPEQGAQRGQRRPPSPGRHRRTRGSRAAWAATATVWTTTKMPPDATTAPSRTGRSRDAYASRMRVPSPQRSKSLRGGPRTCEQAPAEDRANASGRT